MKPEILQIFEVCIPVVVYFFILKFCRRTAYSIGRKFHVEKNEGYRRAWKRRKTEMNYLHVIFFLVTFIYSYILLCKPNMMNVPIGYHIIVLILGVILYPTVSLRFLHAGREDKDHGHHMFHDKKRRARSKTTTRVNTVASAQA